MPTLAEVERYARALASLDDFEEVFDPESENYSSPPRIGYREHYYRKAARLLKILGFE